MESITSDGQAHNLIAPQRFTHPIRIDTNLVGILYYPNEIKCEAIMSDESLTSSFSTLALLAIRESRLERSIPQGRLGQAFGVTASGWGKIENGDSPFTFDAAFAACEAIGMQPSVLMETVTRLVPLFNSGRWYFQTVTLGPKEDQLLALISKYFGSSGYASLRVKPISERVSVIPNIFQSNLVPTVVRYCCEANYREWIDNGAEGEAPLLPVAPHLIF